MNKETIKVAGLSSIAGMMLVGVAAVASDTASTPAATEQTASSDTEGYTCGDALAQDDTSVLLAANTDMGSADCMFVGCGGVF